MNTTILRTMTFLGNDDDFSLSILSIKDFWGHSGPKYYMAISEECTLYLHSYTTDLLICFVV